MMPRVLFLTERFPPDIGGVASSAYRIAANLQKETAYFHVLTIRENLPPAYTETFSYEGIPVTALGPLKNSELTLQLLGKTITDLQEIYSFNLLQGFYLVYSGYLAAFYGNLLQIRSLVCARGNDVDKEMFSPALPFLIWTLENANAITCVSRELKKKCLALYNRLGVFYVPNSVNTDIFRKKEKNTQLQKVLSIKEGEKVIGFTGEIRFKKGFSYLLEAFSSLPVPAKLLLVGKIRKNEHKILQKIDKQIQENIILVDYIKNPEELADYYNLMDLFVCPSLWEGMPNSVLEAMSCQVPCLGSYIGGIKDLLKEGETGFTIQANCLEQLGEKCLKILEKSPAELGTIGENARQFVLDNHQPDIEAKHYLSIYSDLL